MGAVLTERKPFLLLLVLLTLNLILMSSRVRGSGRGSLLLVPILGVGISLLQSVISPRGVVGSVIEAAPGIAKVQMILDPNSAVAALLQRTRIQGIVVGEGDRGCRMDYVSELANVEVGDVVVTSGLDEIYPKGDMIGVVSEIEEGGGLTEIGEV